MKRIIISILPLAVFGIVGSALAQQAPEAANQPSFSEVDDQQLTARCQSAQRSLRLVVTPNDRRARVDRLQTYQYINQRLDLFVDRLERHRQPQAEPLRQIELALVTGIDNFKTAYETYDAARERLAGLVDCQKQPAEFKLRLSEARRALNELASQTTDIDELLSRQLRPQLRTLRSELAVADSPGASNREPRHD